MTAHTSPVSERRPDNLAAAPELLTLAQAAHAMGMSLKNVRKLEAADPTFPRRKQIPWGKVSKFYRAELIAWFDANIANPAGREAC